MINNIAIIRWRFKDYKTGSVIFLWKKHRISLWARKIFWKRKYKWKYETL